MYNVGILGCGKIFDRHIEAIIENSKDFNLVALCDNEESKYRELKKNFSDVSIFKDYRAMINSSIDFVVISTPNSMHFEQAKFFLENNCDVLIEKPATLNPENVRKISEIAKENNQKAYSVLQVRLNKTVKILKELIENKKIGNINSITLSQRWQRPLSYFDDWRGIPKIGGGTLHECGIHYLDIVCFLFGKPNVIASNQYSSKHKSAKIEDTVHSIVSFGDFGGIFEVTIACEPSNIECSLTILTSEGFIKIGGKALNKVIDIKFKQSDLEDEIKSIFSMVNYEQAVPNNYKNYEGSCPNHPSLYRNLNKFDISVTYDVLDLIDEIYNKCDLKYY